MKINFKDTIQLHEGSNVFKSQIVNQIENSYYFGGQVTVINPDNTFEKKDGPSFVVAHALKIFYFATSMLAFVPKVRSAKNFVYLQIAWVSFPVVMLLAKMIVHNAFSGCIAKQPPQTIRETQPQLKETKAPLETEKNRIKLICEKNIISDNNNIPEYAKRFMEDRSITEPVKELFKLIFIDVLNPQNWKNEPFGVKSCTKKFGEFFEGNKIKNDLLTAYNEKYSTNLIFMTTQHSSSEKDPWQTTKIVDNKEINKDDAEKQVKSDLLWTLNEELWNHYKLSSGEANLNQITKKRGGNAFLQGNTIMKPQVQITILDVGQIFGFFNSDMQYLQSLNDAYTPNSNNTIIRILKEGV